MRVSSDVLNIVKFFFLKFSLVILDFDENALRDLNTETRDDAIAIVNAIQANNGVATGEQIYELIQTLNIGTYVNSPHLAYTCFIILSKK